MFAALVDRIEIYVVLESPFIVLKAFLPAALVDPLAGEKTSFLRRLSLSHPLYDHDGAAVEKIRLAATCRAGRADFVVAVQARSEDG